MSVDRPRAAASSGRERVLLVLILGVAGALYAWHLGSVGWMNQYYAAVAQSASASWKGFFYATSDLTAMTATDKPPLAFWPMAASVRVFGLHPWSVALPQVVETLATVVVIHLTVRRLAGRVAGLVAAAVLAVTPVVVVLARFDDPDTLLTLLATTAAYLTVRAARSERRRWLVLLGITLGLAFLTKWLVALVPVPAFAAVVLRGRPTVRRPTDGAVRRSAIVAAMAGAAAVSWVLVVLLTPTSIRPYPDSPTGSLASVILGQDGVTRILAAGPVRASSINGLPGLGRLVTAPFGGQVGWLLPAAALALLVALVGWLGSRRRRRLPDGYLLFGGWFLLAGSVFSVMSGAMHPYYTDLLAPAAAALVGLGVADARRALRSEHARWGLRVNLAVVVLALGWYAASVLSPYPSLVRWQLPIWAGAAVAATGLLLGGLSRTRSGWGTWVRWLTAGSAAIALLTGPVAFSAATLDHPVLGADPLAGPAETGSGHAPFDLGMVSFLRRHDSGPAQWAAAVVTATPASELQLQTRRPVLAFGGFTGHAGFPSLSQFQGWVADGRLRYLVLAGPYTGWSGAVTPPGMVGTPTGNVMAWAGRHGCQIHLPGAHYAILDLSPTAPCRSASAPGA